MKEWGKQERLSRLFQAIDTDGSGTITPEALLEGVQEAGFSLAVKQIRVTVKFADIDGKWSHFTR